MLEGLSQIPIDQVIYRLANPPQVRDALFDLQLSLEDALETLDFFALKSAEDAITLLDTPFLEDASYRPSPTRFSNGTWRVFYSALEPETAEAERAHWCRREAQSMSATSRQFHYRQLRCRLKGNGYDLRLMRMQWSFLTGDGTYPRCQALAKQAKDAQATAMLCPSARNENGTTTPVFVREVLSEPTILGIAILVFESSGELHVIHA